MTPPLFYSVFICLHVCLSPLDFKMCVFPFTHLHCWPCAPSPTPTHSSPKPQGSLLLMMKTAGYSPTFSLSSSLRSLAGDVATQNKDRTSQAHL